MSIRWVFPAVTKHGFGNNFFGMVRAHLIAETCHLEYCTPIWPPCIQMKDPSPCGYAWYYPFTKADRRRWWMARLNHRLQERLRVRLWPSVAFSKDVAHRYRGKGLSDEGEACLAYLRDQGLDNPRQSLTVLVHGGDLSRYAGIRRGRAWLADTMMQHPRTSALVSGVDRRTAGCFRVAIQVRMGDFAERGRVTVDGVPTRAGVIVSGERNVRLPLDWYVRIARQLREAGDCRFVLVTDGSEAELRPLIDVIDPVHIIGETYQDMAGALILARSDLVICSNSTYCRLAVFLNDRPYVWPADALYPDDSGRYGYLWKDGDRSAPDDQAQEKSEAVRRCFAIPVGFQVLPVGLQRYVKSGGRLPVEVGNDLIYRDPVFRLD